MCNPRRVIVRFTEQINEAWESEVRRIVALSGVVEAEAHMRQPLGESVGAPALRALENMLASGASGWVETEADVYRFDVEGGYVLYHLEDSTLEIVAFQSQEVSATGQATEQIGGIIDESVEAEGVGRYYDDGWGDQTEESAGEAAKIDAQRNLKEQRDQLFQRVTNEREQEVSARVEQAARQKADEEYQRTAAQIQEALRRQVSANLNAVGMRGRRAVFDLLAQAYQQVILAYAARQGGNIVRNEHEGNIVDIEFTFRN